MSLRYTSAMLRRELTARGLALARSRGLMHDQVPGDDSSVIFGCSSSGVHGNFHDASYRRICDNPAWTSRLTKAHTAWKRARPRANWMWRELDSSSSSDALLMNIFCHPGVFDDSLLSQKVAAMLGVPRSVEMCFGLTPRVPLRSNASGRSLTDRTEIDLRLGNLYVEAKLTETGFQSARPALIERYRDFEAVFDPGRLPRRFLPVSRPPDQAHPDYDSPSEEISGEHGSLLQSPTPAAFGGSREMIQGYQLIRNVLAAFADDAGFAVLCDSRRQDLIEIWYAVMSAVIHPGFTWRLKLLTWQELAAVLPGDLQEFLDAKYGIVPA
jgi:hypothetical protein